MKPTEILSRFVVETSFKDLSSGVVKKVKTSLMDTLACGIAGFTLERKALKPILELVKETEGKQESTIMVDGFKTSFLHAALANGSFIHSIDFDDTHQAALTHTSSVVVPAALALGEKLGSTGEEIILAITLGFEAATRVGQSVMPSLARFWHSTALNGTIGSAAVGGKLLGLDADQMNLTFGIAADIASGTYACIEFGDLTKSLHSGVAAMKGLMAAWLVKKGATGPRGIFEYSKGYCRAYSDNPKIEKITENLGNPFEITFNSVKAFPSILASHTALQALIRIMEREGIRGDRIKQINLRTYDLVESSFCNYDPQTLLAARLSVPFCLALAAVDGQVNLQNFGEDRIFDPQVRELMGKIGVRADPQLNALYPEKFPADVEVITEDGKKFSESEYYPRGSYKNPLTDRELQQKFLSLATVAFPKDHVKKIILTINRMEKLELISELTGLLVRS